MGNWPQQELSRLIEVRHGYAFKSEYFTDAGQYVLLTPGNFREEGGFKWLNGRQKYYQGEIPAETILKQDDLLVVMTEQAPGLLGSAIRIPQNNRFLHNQRLGLVRVRDGAALSRDYLYYLFNSEMVRKTLATSATGSKVKHTSPGRIGDVRVPLPPLPIQKEIADVLRVWDMALGKITSLIESKQQYYRVMSNILLFGQNQLRSGENKTRWFSIPDHWKLSKMGSVASEVKTTNRAGEALPVLSCTKHNGLVDSLQYFDKQVYSKDTSSYKIVAEEQFAYATNHIEEGSIGYQDLYRKGLVSPMYTVFETGKDIHDGFLYKLLKTEIYRHIFEVNTSASVDRRGSLRWNQFANLPVPLPPIAEQKKISQTLDLARQEIDLLESQYTRLAKQKDSLHSKLLAGEWPPG